MFGRTSLGVATLLALALSAGACSSNSSSSASSSPPTTGGSSSATTMGSGSTIPKAQFITEADAICTKLNTQINALKPPAADPTTATADQLPAWGAFLDQLLPIGNSGVAQLAALPLPDQNADKIAQARAAEVASSADATKADAAAKAGSVADFKAAIGQFAIDSKMSSDAETAFGLKVCGTN